MRDAAPRRRELPTGEKRESQNSLQQFRLSPLSVYQMYRCGTVHEFEPKVLRKKNGQTLAWLCYQGNRTAQHINPPGIGPLTVTHLEPVAHVAGRSFWLPVSTNCLLDDLVAAINRFIASGPEADRVAGWNQAAQELSAPEPCEFTVP
jgi:hypothetical protein